MSNLKYDNFITLLLFCVCVGCAPTASEFDVTQEITVFKMGGCYSENAEFQSLEGINILSATSDIEVEISVVGREVRISGDQNSEFLINGLYCDPSRRNKCELNVNYWSAILNNNEIYYWRDMAREYSYLQGILAVESSSITPLCVGRGGSVDLH